MAKATEKTLAQLEADFAAIEEKRNALRGRIDNERSAGAIDAALETFDKAKEKATKSDNRKADIKTAARELITAMGGGGGGRDTEEERALKTKFLEAKHPGKGRKRIRGDKEKAEFDTWKAANA